MARAVAATPQIRTSHSASGLLPGRHHIVAFRFVGEVGRSQCSACSWRDPAAAE